MKTVRFSQVVARSGKPHAHSLWVAPEDDPEFRRAKKADRVMTIESAGRGKADVGRVGFDAAHSPGRQFLIFPKSLKPFARARVVGIKFDALEQPAPLKPAKRAEVRPSRPAPSQPRPAPTSMRQKPVRKGHSSLPARPTEPAVRTPQSRRRPAPTRGSLKDEVLAALKEMRGGESVAAYERLSRAVEE